MDFGGKWSLGPFGSGWQFCFCAVSLCPQPPGLGQASALPAPVTPPLAQVTGSHGATESWGPDFLAFGASDFWFEMETL